MRVEILGVESLGVRALCCVVKVKGREIVIDPGLALGYQRHGLLPHPAQVAVGEGEGKKRRFPDHLFQIRETGE